MAYTSNADLPHKIRKYLPEDAQDIYRDIFNSAVERYGPAHEDAARRLAWSAVKRRYTQRAPGVWTRRPHPPMP